MVIQIVDWMSLRLGVLLLLLLLLLLIICFSSLEQTKKKKTNVKRILRKRTLRKCGW